MSPTGSPSAYFTTGCEAVYDRRKASACLLRVWYPLSATFHYGASTRVSARLTRWPPSSRNVLCIILKLLYLTQKFAIKDFSIVNGREGCHQSFHISQFGTTSGNQAQQNNVRIDRAGQTNNSNNRLWRR